MQISIRVGVVQAMVFPLELTKPVRGTKGSSGSILTQSPKRSKFSESATPGAGTLPAGFVQTFNDFEVDNTEPNGPWSSSSFPLTRRSFRNSGCRSCSMGIDHLHRIQSAVDAPMASIATSEFLHFLLRNPWRAWRRALIHRPDRLFVHRAVIHGTLSPSPGCKEDPTKQRKPNPSSPPSVRFLRSAR